MLMDPYYGIGKTEVNYFSYIVTLGPDGKIHYVTVFRFMVTNFEIADPLSF